MKRLLDAVATLWRTVCAGPREVRSFGEIFDEALRDTDRMSIRIGALERACSEDFDEEIQTEGARRAFMRR